MSTWVDLDDRVVEFADEIAKATKVSREQVILDSLLCYRDEMGLQVELEEE